MGSFQDFYAVREDFFNAVKVLTSNRYSVEQVLVRKIQGELGEDTNNLKIFDLDFIIYNIKKETSGNVAATGYHGNSIVETSGNSAFTGYHGNSIVETSGNSAFTGYHGNSSMTKVKDVERKEEEISDIVYEDQIYNSNADPQLSEQKGPCVFHNYFCMFCKNYVDFENLPTLRLHIFNCHFTEEEERFVMECPEEGCTHRFTFSRKSSMTTFSLSSILHHMFSIHNTAFPENIQMLSCLDCDFKHISIPHMKRHRDAAHPCIPGHMTHSSSYSSTRDRFVHKDDATRLDCIKQEVEDTVLYYDDPMTSVTLNGDQEDAGLSDLDTTENSIDNHPEPERSSGKNKQKSGPKRSTGGKVSFSMPKVKLNGGTVQFTEFRCVFCVGDPLFDDFSMLENHLHSEHFKPSSEDKYEMPCPETTCSKTFSSIKRGAKGSNLGAILYHMKWKHNRSFPPYVQTFPCSVDGCDYVHVTPSALRHHVSDIHERDRSRHPCDLCGAPIVPKHLSVHKRYHCSMNKPTEKNFACHMCDAKFTSKKHLNLHLKRYHERKRKNSGKGPSKAAASASNLDEKFETLLASLETGSLEGVKQETTSLRSVPDGGDEDIEQGASDDVMDQGASDDVMDQGASDDVSDQGANDDVMKQGTSDNVRGATLVDDLDHDPASQTSSRSSPRSSNSAKTHALNMKRKLNATTVHFLEFRCMFCEGDPSFRNYTTLADHIRSEHFKETGDAIMMQCPEASCTKTFKWDLGTILYHMKCKHDRDFPSYVETFPCPIEGCDYVQVNTRRMKQHIFEIHERDRTRIVCDLCGSMVGPKYMNVHKKYHCIPNMPAEKNYKCDLCEDSFISRMHLKNHVRRQHTGLQRDKLCQFCPYKAMENFALEVHMYKKHQHNPKNLPVLKCDECSYEDIFACKLKSHKTKSHGQPVACPICDKVLINADHLRKHQEVHLNITHQCDQCSFSTNRKALLMRHIRAQHEKRKIHCHYCDYTSGYCENVIKHMRLKHGYVPNKKRKRTA